MLKPEDYMNLLMKAMKVISKLDNQSPIPRTDQQVLAFSGEYLNILQEHGRSDLVTITREEYRRLLADQYEISALDVAGLDNWVGYEMVDLEKINILASSRAANYQR